eukprot:gb/GEZN01001869.1/.p1 GENE.gb/GEZN01001869.1/~~gb/GEZN01001869.1/.p1  ORF type:complete len:880 (-),score=141.28 gb/GEZN01001869.1/:16-2655(-)
MGFCEHGEPDGLCTHCQESVVKTKPKLKSKPNSSFTNRARAVMTKKDSMNVKQDSMKGIVYCSHGEPGGLCSTCKMSTERYGSAPRTRGLNPRNSSQTDVDKTQRPLKLTGGKGTTLKSSTSSGTPTAATSIKATKTTASITPRGRTPSSSNGQGGEAPWRREDWTAAELCPSQNKSDADSLNDLSHRPASARSRASSIAKAAPKSRSRSSSIDQGGGFANRRNSARSRRNSLSTHPLPLVVRDGEADEGPPSSRSRASSSCSLPPPRSRSSSSSQTPRSLNGVTTAKRARNNVVENQKKPSSPTRTVTAHGVWKRKSVPLVANQKEPDRMRESSGDSDLPAPEASEHMLSVPVVTTRNRCDTSILGPPAIHDGTLSSDSDGDDPVEFSDHEAEARDEEGEDEETEGEETPPPPPMEDMDGTEEKDEEPPPPPPAEFDTDDGQTEFDTGGGRTDFDTSGSRSSIQLAAMNLTVTLDRREQERGVTTQQTSAARLAALSVDGLESKEELAALQVAARALEEEEAALEAEIRAHAHGWGGPPRRSVTSSTMSLTEDALAEISRTDTSKALCLALSLSRDELEARSTELMSYLKSGVRVLKYSRHKKPHPVKLVLSGDLRKICWGFRQFALTDDLLDVQPGRRTELFSKYDAAHLRAEVKSNESQSSLLEELSLSLIFSNRILCIQLLSGSRKDRDKVFHAVQWLLRTGRHVLPVDAEGWARFAWEKIALEQTFRDEQSGEHVKLLDANHRSLKHFSRVNLVGRLGKRVIRWAFLLSDCVVLTDPPYKGTLLLKQIMPLQTIKLVDGHAGKKQTPGKEKDHYTFQSLSLVSPKRTFVFIFETLQDKLVMSKMLESTRKELSERAIPVDPYLLAMEELPDDIH